jgi:hypothetical protein
MQWRVRALCEPCARASTRPALRGRGRSLGRCPTPCLPSRSSSQPPETRRASPCALRPRCSQPAPHTAPHSVHTSSVRRVHGCIGITCTVCAAWLATCLRRASAREKECSGAERPMSKPEVHTAPRRQWAQWALNAVGGRTLCEPWVQAAQERCVDGRRQLRHRSACCGHTGRSASKLSLAACPHLVATRPAHMPCLVERG